MLINAVVGVHLLVCLQLTLNLLDEFKEENRKQFRY